MMSSVAPRQLAVALFGLGLLAQGCGADEATSDYEPQAEYDAGTYDTATEHYDTGSSYDASYDTGGSYDTGTSSDASSYADASGADTSAPIPSEGEVDPSSDGETYAELVENTFIDTSEDNLATFSVDVDTASYGIARRSLHNNYLPAPESVRVEEYLNFFDYGYEAPKIGIDDAPFSLELDAGPSLFGEDLEMLRIGMQGAVVSEEDRLPTNLVFLVDTSGSMFDEMSLIRYSLSVLVEALRPNDRIAIVTYAGSSDVLLESTPIAQRADIYEAISTMQAGGGTWGEGGIVQAYDQAEAGFIAGGINRVVLCTDGDFNIGLTGDALVDLIVDFRDRDIFLTGLGFGEGNYNDAQLEALTNHGNGNYTYIYDRNDALHVLGESVTSMMQVIAADVKLQVELNPDLVSRYRIVGYDNRVLEDWQFVDDTVDAAEVGAGQNVTALIEFELHEGVDLSATDQVLATVYSRYKLPGEDESVEISRELLLGQLHEDAADFEASTQWALGVTEFAEILRHSQHSEGARFDELETLLQPLVNENLDRQELVYLVDRAATLWSE